MADPDRESPDVGIDLLAVEEDPGARRARRRRGALAVQVCAAVLALVVLGVAGLAWYTERALSSDVHTLPANAFGNLPGRPAAAPATAAGTPLTVLLLGSDRRVGADAGGGVTGQRADAILLVRFSADRRRIDVLSIPRDSWVSVPGRGTSKINASFAGGAPLVVRTVESLTGIRVDHVMVIDFDGLRELTTALGGVTVVNDHASTDPLTHRHFDAGPITLSGDRALTFVRERYGLPGGDFDRMAHQQELIAAIGDQLVRAHLIAHPVLLHDVVSVVATNLTVDAGLTADTMTRLLVDIVSTPRGSVHFYIAPSAGFGRSADGESYVRLDTARLTAACAALRADRPVPLPATAITLP